MALGVRELLDTRQRFRRTGEDLATGDDIGLFGPASMLWRVNREAVLLAGGGRALILQVAHPLVAAGVEQHSSYKTDPLGRLYRSLDIPLRIVFGDSAAVARASRAFRAVHVRVAGETDESAGRYPAGTAYDSRTDELKMWVHATLTDTALVAYQRFVGPLTGSELERYYEESLVLGDQYRIPRSVQPPSYADFRAYFDDTVASDRIALTTTLRELVELLREPPLPVVGVPLARATGLFTTASLPPRLREELGLSWGRGREATLAAEAAAIRRLLPLVPRSLRDFPAALGAERRLRRLASASPGVPAAA